MLVTTSYHAHDAMKAKAQAIAAQFGVPCVDRRESSIPRLRKQYGQDDVLIVGETGLRYHAAGAEELFFHPSTALIRLKRLMRGETDVLLELAGVQPGDRILDCTAGLASDSIVFSFAVGPRGLVTALESEPMLAFLVQDGLQSYNTGIPELDEAMKRVEIRRAEHLDFLSKQPDRSFDIVFFDPMFRRPIDESSSLSPLREIANPEPLSERAVAEAVRVARRKVILKENRESREFSRLGFRKIGRSHTKVAYGVIET